MARTNRSKSKTRLRLPESGGNDRPAWHATFIESYARTRNMTLSADRSGVNRDTVLDHMKRYADFKNLVNRCKKGFYDGIEAKALKHAEHGRKKGIYHEGRLVAVEKVYSDALVSLMLKTHKKKYRKADRDEDKKDLPPPPPVINVVLDKG